ncbi:hypothetical protein [Microcoleus sp. FACHB-68]|uniref:hypothetical protein n=1 Tax=Microcoleus sp. FACHB-68 TaxID=2692826 RepID=UPI001682BF3C|nr:hypothetical protein [Microcoleus sp. FACHB-68]MBD1936123.1 hypothetical protein [Microcoleus sp. FACHB-68]
MGKTPKIYTLKPAQPSLRVEAGKKLAPGIILSPMQEFQISELPNSGIIPTCIDK